MHRCRNFTSGGTMPSSIMSRTSSSVLGSWSPKIQHHPTHPNPHMPSIGIKGRLIARMETNRRRTQRSSLMPVVKPHQKTAEILSHSQKMIRSGKRMQSNVVQVDMSSNKYRSSSAVAPALTSHAAGAQRRAPGRVGRVAATPPRVGAPSRAAGASRSGVAPWLLCKPQPTTARHAAPASSARRSEEVCVASGPSKWLQA